MAKKETQRVIKWTKMSRRILRKSAKTMTRRIDYMEQQEVIEKREPHIEVEYTLNKSEKFAKEEITVKISEPLIFDKKDELVCMVMLEKEIEYRIKAVKQAVQKNI